MGIGVSEGSCHQPMLPVCPARGDKSHFPYRDHLRAGVFTNCNLLLTRPPFFTRQFHTSYPFTAATRLMPTSVQNGKTESRNGNPAATITSPFHHPTIPLFHHRLPHRSCHARPDPNPTYEPTPFIRLECTSRGSRFFPAFTSLCL